MLGDQGEGGGAQEEGLRVESNSQEVGRKCGGKEKLQPSAAGHRHHSGQVGEGGIVGGVGHAGLPQSALLGRGKEDDLES